jgi:DNA-directed RNA polymerase subunit RPC12/RpoP
MTVTIPRVADASELDAVSAPAYVRLDGAKVIYTCGGCGRWTHFADGKTVDADGNVTPSILCRNCGWHVWGRLLDWEPAP